MSRRTPPYALQLSVDRRSPRLAGGVSTAIVGAIADGRLADGDPVPSTRAMASNLGIARSVVVEAYAELSAAGFFVTRAGGGTWVEYGATHAARAGALASPRPAPQPADSGTQLSNPPSGLDPEFDLRPGRADTSFIDEASWSRAWRQAAGASVRRWGSAGSSEGAVAPPMPVAPEVAVAGYLRQTRGLVVDPADLCFFPNVAAALSVLSGATSRRTGTLAIESPGYDTARQAFRSGGASVRSVSVDDEGLNVGSLRWSDWGVYVTPAHQFPTGCRMSVSRRSALLDWAAETGGLVFEDDYDGEFRYDVPPMPPVRAMNRRDAERRVVYIGTSSKILTAELRVAWAVVPAHLRSAVDDSQVARGAHVSTVALAALADLIQSRALARQLVRAYRVYGARRARLVDALHEQLPDLEVVGIEAGLHLLLGLPDGVDDGLVSRELASRGLLCSPLGRYFPAGVRLRRRGLVCGYANLPETRAAAAVALIRDVLEPLMPR